MTWREQFKFISIETKYNDKLTTRDVLFSTTTETLLDATLDSNCIRNITGQQIIGM